MNARVSTPMFKAFAIERMLSLFGPQCITTITGGQVFASDDPERLRQVFQSIDAMQVTRVEKIQSETLDHSPCVVVVVLARDALQDSALVELVDHVPHTFGEGELVGSEVGEDAGPECVVEIPNHALHRAPRFSGARRIGDRAIRS